MKNFTFRKTLPLVMVLGLSSALFYCNKKDSNTETNKVEGIKIEELVLIPPMKLKNTIDEINKTGIIIWEGANIPFLIAPLVILTTPEAIPTYYLEGKQLPLITGEFNEVKFTTEAGKTRVFKIQKHDAVVTPVVKNEVKITEITLGMPFNVQNTMDEINKSGVIIWSEKTAGTPWFPVNPDSFSTDPANANNPLFGRPTSGQWSIQ